jgi:uncharacterized protein YqhQ
LLTWAVAAPTAQVGGQAVIEGVMMRGVANWNVAVRDPEGEIQMVDDTIRPWASRHRLVRLPVIRGVVALGESLVIGMKALAISAQKAAGEDEEGEEAFSKLALGLTLTFSLVLAVGLFFVLPVWLTTLFDFESGFTFWAFEGVLRVLILIAYLALISLMPDLKRVFQYHAAEHMAIHAHEAGKPLVAEEANRFSQLHVRCGTAFLLIVMVISVFVFAVVGTPALHWLILSRIVGVPVVAGISYEAIRWAGRNKDKGYVQFIMQPGLWLQHLTTRKPDLTQLEVACESLKRVLALESNRPEWADKVEVMA